MKLLKQKNQQNNKFCPIEWGSFIFKKDLKKEPKQCKIDKNKKERGKRMYLIVGLGNPEQEYSNTRHNMGFDTINQISTKYNIETKKSKFQGLYGKGKIEDEDVILLKPQTYMNLSGICIKQFVEFYKIDKEEILIIYDDMDIEPGKIKIKKKGSSGGHNGMKSIIQELGTEEFHRIRIGIGKPLEEQDKINYVIGKIQQQEILKLHEGVEEAEKAVVEIIKNGIDIAMNKFN